MGQVNSVAGIAGFGKNHNGPARILIHQTAAQYTLVNSTIKFVNSKSNLRLGGARMMGTPRALSKLLRPPPKNCLPGHLCLKTMLSTSGQPLRRRCLPKQNCSRTCIYHRPLATPLNFGTITGNNSSCSTKYLARFCAHQQVKRRLSACFQFPDTF